MAEEQEACFYATPLGVYSRAKMDIPPDLEAFFAREPATRDGIILLRGTRLTPHEVLQIAQDGALGDYPQLTPQQVAACDDIVGLTLIANTLAVFDTLDVHTYHVTRSEWDTVDYTDVKEEDIKKIFGELTPSNK
jgi:uncharacterized protein (DUF433 family)